MESCTLKTFYYKQVAPTELNYIQTFCFDVVNGLLKCYLVYYDLNKNIFYKLNYPIKMFQSLQDIFC